MATSVEVTTPSDREIRVTRTFDAPPELVFQCQTRPEYLKQWLLGPPGWSMPICEVDLRVGGRYRYVWRNDADGSEFGVQGEFREIEPPRRIVNIETMDGVSGESLCTITFEESDGATRFAITMKFDSRELRDMALQSGMTDGMDMSYERLENLFGDTEAPQ